LFFYRFTRVAGFEEGFSKSSESWDRGKFNIKKIRKPTLNSKHKTATALTKARICQSGMLVIYRDLNLLQSTKTFVYDTITVRF